MKNLLDLRGPVAARPVPAPAATHDTNELAADSLPVARADSVTPLYAGAVLPSTTSGRAIQTASIAELEQLVGDDALTTFRTLQSFGYAASLLFHRVELAYYVALYQHGSLWRVLKTVDPGSAEAAFRHFGEQATRLSDDEMRHAQREAQNDQLARLITQAETQAERLRTDLDSHAAQVQQVAQRQQQVRREIALLEAQRVAAQAQLNRLRRQIHQIDLAGNERIPHLPAR